MPFNRYNNFITNAPLLHFIKKLRDLKITDDMNLEENERDIDEVYCLINKI